MRSNKWCWALVVLLCAAGAGCVDVQPVAFPVGPQRLPPKSAQAEVLVFKDSTPGRTFTAVAHLNVHIEKTFFLPSAFDEALPKLKMLARQNGADAIMDIKEKKSQLLETFIYNVSATAIVFDDRQASLNGK